MSVFTTSQQKAYSKIRTMILNGELKSGERIPEVKVAERVGLKRGPVRESLIQLESDGLLVREPHFGFAVRKYTIEEVRELYELREVIEGGAAALAAKNASQQDIERIERAHRAFKEQMEIEQEDGYEKNQTYAKGKETRKGSHDYDELFHRAILKASKNSRFQEIFGILNDQHICLSSYYKGELVYKNLYTKDTYDHHQLILEAIIDNDSETAEREIRLHIRRATAGMIKLMELLGDGVYAA